MMDRRTLLVNLATLLALPSLAGAATATDKVVLTDAQWKARLSPETYRVMRHDGTEMAFSSPLDEEKRAGTVLLRRLARWRSTPRRRNTTAERAGRVLGAVAECRSDAARYLNGFPETEVHCRRCDGHLGHAVLMMMGRRRPANVIALDGVSLTFKLRPEPA